MAHKWKMIDSQQKSNIYVYVIYLIDDRYINGLWINKWKYISRCMDG